MIRQQLIHAGDIRRIRKKAPCTHAEIAAIRKKLLEDEIFREAVLTGGFNIQLYTFCYLIISFVESCNCFCCGSITENIIKDDILSVFNSSKCLYELVTPQVPWRFVSID